MYYYRIWIQSILQIINSNCEGKFLRFAQLDFCVIMVSNVSQIHSTLCKLSEGHIAEVNNVVNSWLFVAVYLYFGYVSRNFVLS